MHRLQSFVIVGVVFLFLLVPLAHADLKDGLVVYLPFDEGQGTTAKDQTANKHDGKITKAEWVQGQFGKALKFNGKDSFVEIEYTDDFNITEGITLSAWVLANVPFATVWKGIINAKKSNYGPYLLQTGAGSVGELGIYFKGAWTYLQTKTPLEAKTFHYLVGTYDQKNGMHIYYDGKLDDGAGSAGAKLGPIDANADEGVAIGHNYGLADRFWDGVIDEVAIYNRALTADEVAQLYKAPPSFAVDFAGKLSTTWGQIKEIR